MSHYTTFKIFFPRWGSADKYDSEIRRAQTKRTKTTNKALI